MPFFLRSRANFVAPPGYICATANFAAKGMGHSPIAIRLTGLGAHVVRTDTVGGAASYDLQVRVNGAGAGPILSITSGSGAVSVIDPGIIVPAVTTGNIDGASLFGLLGVGGIGGVDNTGDDSLAVTLPYETVDEADTGKEVWGVGSETMIAGSVATYYPGLGYQRFAPPVTWFANEDGLPYVSGNEVFCCPNELMNIVAGTGLPGGINHVTSVAAVPWASYSEWTDFRLVLRAAPAAGCRVYVRVNGETKITVAATAGSQRLWTPTGATSVRLSPGNMVCLLGENDHTAAVDGEFVWTSRTMSSASGVLGAGESGGEF